MAPLPSNSTNRIFIDYVTSSSDFATEHTFQVRHLPQSTTIGVMEVIFDFLTAITPARFYSGWQAIGARFQGAGQNFSVPIDMNDSLAGFVGTGGAEVSATQGAIEHTFQGRSQLTGRRVDLSLYGLNIGIGDNFRFTGNEASWVAPLSVFMTANSSGQGVFVAIDGSAAVWRPYLNANFNSYWERRIRTG